MLSVHGLAKRYDSPNHPGGLTILDNLSVEVTAGSSVAVMGPSGSGKSTFLHLIGGLDRPDHGNVVLDDVNLYKLPDRELARVRNRDIGFVFQHHHLLPQCTVLENALLPALVANRSAAPYQDRAVDLLERVGLADRVSHRPGELSGGERQRVAVVRALLLQPKIVLADEPTGSLDTEAARNLSGLLLSLNQEHGVTLIAATHSPAFASMMQRVLRLQDGSLEEHHEPVET
jgi:ABC-type lipoprotein export system ATPase subunit